jgi:hypothetical protein
MVDEMSTVNESMLSPDGTVAEPLVAGLDEVPALDEDAGDAEVVADDVGDEDDEQPATTMAAAAAAATQPNLGSALNVPWPCERECHPLCPLERRTIPYPFRHNAVGYADAGQRTTHVSVRVER